jgi:hypothetical protein
MSVRFVSQDLAWTESMKNSVQMKIVEPLTRYLKSGDFEISIHLDIGWKKNPEVSPRFEMWVVLQTFDGRQNSVVRREGTNFAAVANDVSSGVRAELKRPRRSRFFVLF